jgi:hypothetical protein
MSGFTCFSLCVAIVLSVGCARQSGQEAPPPEILGKKREVGPSPEVADTSNPRTYLSYASFDNREKSHKSYVLIAGGGDDANFAQEVIEQRRLLLELGVPQSEIACFYTIPNHYKFHYDRKQYLELAVELKNCYAAYPAYVWQLLEDSTTADAPTYLYVSSHGLLPISEGLKKWKLPPERLDEIKKWITDFPLLNQFTVSLDAFKEETELDLEDRIKKVRAGADVRDLFFTPRYLKEILRAKEPRTAPLNIVIQACYSGGFADTDNVDFKPDTLRGLDKLTLLTAARYDRSSFGCGSGNFRTFFGGAYNDEWAERKQLPEKLDWQSLYDKVIQRVDVLEAEYVKKEKPEIFYPSLPMFYEN